MTPAICPRIRCSISAPAARASPARRWPASPSDQHPHVTLGRGDVVIFSSRIIPGNEKAIFKLQNMLGPPGRRSGDGKGSFRPCLRPSGPRRNDPDVQPAAPAIAVPVHGENRHQLEHAALARACDVPHTLVIENGDMVKLAPGEPEVVDHVVTGRLAVDGNRLVPMDSEIMRSRHRMVHNGSAVVTIVLDKTGKLLGDPQVTALGLLHAEHEAEEHDAVVEAVRVAILELGNSKRRRMTKSVREAARLAVRRHLKSSHGKKPLTDVHLVRLK